MIESSSNDEKTESSIKVIATSSHDSSESGSDDHTMVESHLFYLYHYEAKRFIPIYDGFSIGRGSARLSIPEDNRLSRIHVQFKIKGSEVLVVDNHSSNGSRINKFKLGANQPVPLKLHDLIAIGRQNFAFTTHRDPERLPIVVTEQEQEVSSFDLPLEAALKEHFRLFLRPRVWDKSTWILTALVFFIWIIVIQSELGSNIDFLPDTPHSPAKVLFTSLLRLTVCTLPVIWFHDFTSKTKIKDKTKRFLLLSGTIPLLLLTSSILLLLPDLRSENRLMIHCLLHYKEKECLKQFQELNRYFLRLPEDTQKKISDQLQFKVPITLDRLTQLESYYQQMFEYFKNKQYDPAIQVGNQILQIKENYRDTKELLEHSKKFLAEQKKESQNKNCVIVLLTSDGRSTKILRSFDQTQCIRELQSNVQFYCEPKMDFSQAPRPAYIEFYYLNENLGRMRCFQTQ